MRPRHEWEGDIKLDVTEVMCDYWGWVYLLSVVSSDELYEHGNER
jgi:hypothetical protein